MPHANRHHVNRERIIAAEVRKLELRHARARRAYRQPRATGAGSARPQARRQGEGHVVMRIAMIAPPWFPVSPARLRWHRACLRAAGERLGEPGPRRDGVRHG